MDEWVHGQIMEALVRLGGGLDNTSVIFDVAAGLMKPGHYALAVSRLCCCCCLFHLCPHTTTHPFLPQTYRAAAILGVEVGVVVTWTALSYIIARCSDRLKEQALTGKQ